MQSIIEKSWNNKDLLSQPETVKTINEVIELLDKGQLRVAEPSGDGNWKVNDWVKKAVLLYFPIRKMEIMQQGPEQ